LAWTVDISAFAERQLRKLLLRKGGGLLDAPSDGW
jgi:hypothetical protein